MPSDHTIESQDSIPQFKLILSGKDRDELKDINLSEMQVYIFNEVKQIGPGECFGELALSGKKPRSATIKCLTNCIFAVMGKKDYQTNIDKAFQVKSSQRVKFLQTL